MTSVSIYFIHRFSSLNEKKMASKNIIFYKEKQDIKELYTPCLLPKQIKKSLKTDKNHN